MISCPGLSLSGVHKALKHAGAANEDSVVSELQKQVDDLRAEVAAFQRPAKSCKHL